MSAVTVARLAELLAADDATAYRDALEKAPRLIVVGHLLRLAGQVLLVAARTALAGVRR